MQDIHPLLELINGYAAKGVMLPRTKFEMSENIRDFTLVFSGETFYGCGALHFYSPTVGEVRSLAVHPDAKSQGIGRVLVQALEQEARQFHLHSISLLRRWINFSQSSISLKWNGVNCR